MTEDEAKTKWCPATRIGLTNNITNAMDVAVNRRGKDTPVAEPFTCIGSACMMWRWLSFDLQTNEERVAGKQGYCGLAGKP